MTQARIKHKTICQLTSPISDKPSDIFRMLLLEEKRKKEIKRKRKKSRQQILTGKFITVILMFCFVMLISILYKSYVRINSNLQHPPWATHGHLTVVYARWVGNFNFTWVG